ncbi:hypothetical protein R1flu_000991 [Riccia fluitans]|uniref:Uncharacterized protein n=1 Tax=Riccia fluitans TaxID=41844 RepID=A0ABD1Y208_9MARC
MARDFQASERKTITLVVHPVNEAPGAEAFQCTSSPLHFPQIIGLTLTGHSPEISIVSPPYHPLFLNRFTDRHTHEP